MKHLILAIIASLALPTLTTTADCTRTVTISFSGITFDGSAYGWPDLNTSYDLSLEVGDSRQHGWCKYNLFTKKAMPQGYYAQVWLRTDDNGVSTIVYRLLGPHNDEVAIFFGVGTGSTISNTNNPENGGTATIN